jgi:hypothetical protein
MQVGDSRLLWQGPIHKLEASGIPFRVFSREFGLTTFGSMRFIPQVGAASARWVAIRPDEQDTPQEGAQKLTGVFERWDPGERTYVIPWSGAYVTVSST